MNSMSCRRPDFVCKLEFLINLNNFNVVVPFGISMQILSSS